MVSLGTHGGNELWEGRADDNSTPPCHAVFLAGHSHPLCRGCFWGLQGKEEQDKAAGLLTSLPLTVSLLGWALPPHDLSWSLVKRQHVWPCPGAAHLAHGTDDTLEYKLKWFSYIFLMHGRVSLCAYSYNTNLFKKTYFLFSRKLRYFQDTSWQRKKNNRKASSK